MHCGVQCKSTACVFEYIYFARPDSIIDGASVELARQEAGKYLSIEHPVGADVVIGVPDSGIPAAIGYAKCSGIPYGVGLIKNRYIGRTFIQPGQSKRERSVRLKLNALREAVNGKRVIMVDDSIVRGTTCARLVKLVRDAGAKEVHMRISAPRSAIPAFRHRYPGAHPAARPRAHGRGNAPDHRRGQPRFPVRGGHPPHRVKL